MKRILFFLTVLPLLGWAQQPVWYDLSSRNANFPRSEWFIGFAERTIGNESVETATAKVSNAARVDAIASIQVQVQNTTTDRATTNQVISEDGMMETIYEQLDSHTRTSIDANIPGLKVETYRHGKEIAAFAYVKRRDLQRQLDKSITVALTKLESNLDNVTEMVAQGQKMEARKRLEPLAKNFAEIERDQKLLAVVDAYADAESLQLSESKTLQQRYIKMMAELKNGIKIYLNCKADMLGTNYPTLANTIKGDLSKLGATFVSSPDQADWAIVVNANARQYNAPTIGGYTTYYVYIDASVTIDKVATNQRIYEDALSEKGGHTKNYTEAARDGYKQITPRLTAVINPYIKQ